MGATLVLALALGAACVPDADLDHPCLPESGIYSGCEKVEPGGACTEDEQCFGLSAFCVDGECACMLHCSGKQCGDDGCGGSCGKCTTFCDDKTSQCCKPNCSAKECGDDGCGGSCGECDRLSLCLSGVCELTLWTDKASGLTWQVVPTGGNLDWAAAKSHCSKLDLAGGGWRLPKVGELRTLIRGCAATEDGGSCNVEEGDCLAWSCWDGLCSGCSPGGGPADGCYWPGEIRGTCGWYWSSSPVEDGDDDAWGVHFDGGCVYYSDVFYDVYVRCVR